VRLSIADLTTRSIELELPTKDGDLRSLRLADLAGLTGELHRGTAGTALRRLAADQLTIAQVDWPLSSGRVVVDSPATLADLAFDAELATDGERPLPFFGRAAARSLTGRGVKLQLGSRKLTANLRADELELDQSDAAGFIACSSVELGDVQSALGSVLLRLSRASLGRLRFDWGEGGLVSASSLSAEQLEVVGGGVELQVPHIELPEGLRTSGPRWAAPVVLVPELRLSIADLARLLTGRDRDRDDPTSEAAGETSASASPAAAAARPPRDLRYLDRVGGRLDVDLTLEVVVPVLGRRRATHHFRIPIGDGTFNFKELERDLADLENAFIDVEHRGDKLVIQRDIPLIPGMKRPLLLFDLDPDEQELARRRLVRLRTIATMRRPPGKRDEGKSSVTVKEVDIANIDAALALAPPADGTTDALLAASAASVSARGRLRFAPGKVLEPTHGSLVGTGLAAGPGTLTIAGIDYELDRISAASVELEVDFAGFRPGAATAVIRDLRIDNLRFGRRPAPSEASAPRATTSAD
jgi:hypothetical protein